MTNITIHINGKQIAAQISDEAAAELLQEKKIGYERVEKGEHYYVALDNGDALRICYSGSDRSNTVHYNSGDYYSDKTIAENNARADKLMRQLRQWQALKDAPVDWAAKDFKYNIFYDYDKRRLEFGINNVRSLGGIHFSSGEKAEAAVKAFHDELTWYFTEYQSRLDEPGRTKQ